MSTDSLSRITYLITAQAYVHGFVVTYCVFYSSLGLWPRTRSHVLRILLQLRPMSTDSLSRITYLITAQAYVHGFVVAYCVSYNSLGLCPRIRCHVLRIL